ncbi:MAG: SLC13 family permease [Rhodothermales bacterium]|nr:SLC13 family permease [Rhodothermales bacterium]
MAAPATAPATAPPREGRPLHQRLGLVVGLVVLGGMLALPVPEGLGPAGWRVAAVAALMAVWWMTEALPIAATSLVPLVCFPLLGVAPIRDAAAPYAHPIIFLFLGGFLLAKGMERWGLHRRVALSIIVRLGPRPRRIVLGFMLAAAALSMGISNTATAVMMLPIALSVVELARRDEAGSEAEEQRFALVLMLGVAYACSVGGLATLIGTPTNALLAGFVDEQYGVELSFAAWMSVGLPLSALGLAVVYVTLTRFVFPVRLPEIPGGRAFIRERLVALGPMRRRERLVAVVFGGAALLWITRPLLAGVVPGLSDAGIAIAGALLLFGLPAGAGERLLDWPTARTIPWGVLLLFGGGLSLAAAVADSGLAGWIGERLAAFEAWPTWALVGVVVGTVVLLTELTSNTATAAAFLPVLAALATQVGTEPLLLLVPATVAASCAFMLPVATPPNAIVYGSGHLTIGQMARAGVWLNLALAVLVTALAVVCVPLLTGPVLPPLTP